MDFKAWPSIQNFHQVVKANAGRGKVWYRGKVKLHGTNAAIRVKDGKVRAQSRSRFITPDADNMGFATWLSPHRDEFKHFGDATIYGEWCGPGIQRGVACSQIKSKIFAVFSLESEGTVFTDPDTIAHFMPRIHGIHIVPWITDSFEVNLTLPGQWCLDKMNAHVNVVEKEDPWIRADFDVQGTGEGLVYYPVDPESDTGLRLSMDETDPMHVTRILFKAKGEKHRTDGHKEAAHIRAVASESVAAFVDMAVCEARLEQGKTEIGEWDIRKTGDFIRWILEDIKKECSDELEASNLSWQDVLGRCSGKAAGWYKTAA